MYPVIHMYDQIHGLGGLGFGMLHQPAWAEGSNSSDPPARGTLQLSLPNPYISDRLNNPECTLKVEVTHLHRLNQNQVNGVLDTFLFCYLLVLLLLI